MSTATLNTDGGARGNPGPAAAGIVININGETKEFGKYLGTCTNNEAEYYALILGLKKCNELNITNLTCLLDSELVVKQLNGLYRVKDERMQKLWGEVQKIKKLFLEINFTHIERAKNKHADKIVNTVLDNHGK